MTRLFLRYVWSQQIFEIIRLSTACEKTIFYNIIKVGDGLGAIKEFKALNQIGMPDHDLTEATWELFKISMSDITRNSTAGRLQCEFKKLTFIKTAQK